MERYCGNKKPFLYALYHPSDAAEAERTVARLGEGRAVWTAEAFSKKEELRLQKAAVLLLFVSPASAADAGVHRAVTAATAAGKPVLSIFLKETALPPGLALRSSARRRACFGAC